MLDLDFLVDEELIELPHDAQAPAKKSNWQRLACVIVGDLECCLPGIAASASIVNAWLNSPQVFVPEAALMTYLPASPQVLRAALLQLVEDDVPGDLLRRIQAFDTRLDIARSASGTFCQHPDKTAVRGGVHVEVLAGLWLAVSAEAVPLLEDLRKASGQTEQSCSHSHQMTTLLDDVAAGGWPCVGADGSVEIPGWAERRRELRLDVDWPGVLRSEDGSWGVHVKNISRGGARLSGGHRVAEGQSIELILDGGKGFCGQIVWSNGASSGVKFDAPLSPGDLLLSRAMAERW